MHIRQNISKRKTLIKDDNVADNQDEIIDNLQNDDKNSKSHNVHFEKFKTDKPTCQCDLCELDLEYM